MKVLLTGATGFIGSHIGDALYDNGHQIVGLKRCKSDMSNANVFANFTKWIDCDKDDWKEQVIAEQPEIIIHAAWIGVKANEREDLQKQLDNLSFLSDLLFVAKESNCKKFIGLGSQAEYGNANFKVNEDSPVAPVNAYGTIKVASHQIVKCFCEQNEINWYWLRLFSFFGERESDSWLIPSIVKKAKLGLPINLTAGEQEYAYLYVRDLAKSLCRILDKDVESGVFILSASSTIKIAYLIEEIVKMVEPSCRLNFGAIPYRKNQPMLIQGDSSKFEKEFGKIEISDFNEALKSVVKNILNSHKKNG